VSSPLAAELTLRPALAADRELLLRVYASTRAEELAVVPWSDAQRDAFLRQQFDAQDRYWRAQRPHATFDVIELDGRPAGRLYVDRSGDEEIRIVDIALLPEFRGCGAGSTLLAGLLREGDARGVPVTIHVERGNRARTLYERLGFRQITGGNDVYALMERRPEGGTT